MLRQCSFSSIRNYLQNQIRNKTWAVTDDGTVKIMSLTYETLEGALDVLQEYGLKEENICKAVGLVEEPGAVKEVINVFRYAATDGVSLVAVDNKTDNVVGTAINMMNVHDPNHKKYYEEMSKTSKHKPSKAYYDFVIDVENRADIFNRYKIDKYFDMMFVAIKPKYRNSKITKYLLSSTIKMVKQLNENKDVKTPIDGVLTNANVIPKLIVAMTSSNYSHKCFQSLGIEPDVTVNYADFSYNGQKFSEKIGDEHKTCCIYCIPIDKAGLTV